MIGARGSSQLCLARESGTVGLDASSLRHEISTGISRNAIDNKDPDARIKEGIVFRLVVSATQGKATLRQMGLIHSCVVFKDSIIISKYPYRMGLARRRSIKHLPES